jgi:hypothetical protein
MNKIQIIFTALLMLSVISCKKDKEDENNQSSQNTCPTNSGYFEINMGGSEHILKIDDETNYTILYGWYEENQNGMVIIGSDKNDKSIYIEGNITGKLTVGSHSLDFDNYDFLSIDIDTSSYYTSELTFQITQSNLSPHEGIYKPIRGTFTGTAHSYPWSSGEPPADTISYSGKFCLNGWIM